MSTDNQQDLSYGVLVKKSPALQYAKKDCQLATRLSMTGITNLVVHYEDPMLVTFFLEECFAASELYDGVYGFDAVELQRGEAGGNHAARYLDNLIFGSCQEISMSPNIILPSMNILNGNRVRNRNGFVNRREVIKEDALKNVKDRTLIIKNIDYCMDFCSRVPGVIEPRNLQIFDKFRDPSIKMGCRMFLVSNEPLRFPFSIRAVNFPTVDDYMADHIVRSFIQMYSQSGYTVNISDVEKKKIVRKLKGLTYSAAGDTLGSIMSAKGCKFVKRTQKEVQQK